MLELRLRDTNADLVAAWHAAFGADGSIDISQGEIFDLEADAIVSPANSFGHMDGGIDLVYSRRFGFQLEERLQAALAEHHFGELPVGQAIVVPTGDSRMPFLVSAPTMRVPASIARTHNAYLAFRAALIAVLRHNREQAPAIESVLVPGMGTGVGDMPVQRAARQMKAAYDAIIGGQGVRGRNLGQVWGQHQDLLL